MKSSSIRIGSEIATALTFLFYNYCGVFKSGALLRGYATSSYPNAATDVMTPEETLAGLLLACWGWRIWSLFYSSYSIADVITFKSSSVTPRLVVTGTLIVISLFLHLVPSSEFPLLSLINKLLSIPSEMYTFYFAHRYVSPALNSRRFTAVLCLLTILSVITTLYSIYVDLEKLQ